MVWEWTRCFSEGSLSIALKGPEILLSHVVDHIEIGPVLLLSHFANGMRWAHCFSEGILSTALCWFSVTDEPQCRWYGVGPSCITTKSANGFEWAQYCYSAMMPMAWGGPVVSHKICDL